MAIRYRMEFYKAGATSEAKDQKATVQEANWFPRPVKVNMSTSSEKGWPRSGKVESGHRVFVVVRKGPFLFREIRGNFTGESGGKDSGFGADPNCDEIVLFSA